MADSLWRRQHLNPVFTKEEELSMVEKEANVQEELGEFLSRRRKQE